MKQTFSLNDGIVRRIEEEADKLHTTKSSIVMMALSSYFLLNKVFELIPNQLKDNITTGTQALVNMAQQEKKKGK